MDKTIDFSSLKSEITADKVIDLARKHNDNETLNETLRRKGDSNISSLGIPDEPYFFFDRYLSVFFHVPFIAHSTT